MPEKAMLLNSTSRPISLATARIRSISKPLYSDDSSLSLNSKGTNVALVATRSGFFASLAASFLSLPQPASMDAAKTPVSKAAPNFSYPYNPLQKLNKNKFMFIIIPILWKKVKGLSHDDKPFWGFMNHELRTAIQRDFHKRAALTGRPLQATSSQLLVATPSTPAS